MTRGRIPIITDYAKTDLIHIKVDPYGGDPSSQAAPVVDFFGNIPVAVRSERLRFSYKHPRALVTFTFDDGMATDYTIMKPVFDAQSEVACSNIVTDRVGTATYMTWSQIKELQTDGWEITSHTDTHANLTTLTEAQIRVEFETSIAALEAQGLVINNLAYPGNASNELVRRVAKDYFRSARGGGSMVNPIVLDTYNLRSQVNDDDTLIATYQALVDTAETNGTWLIFYAHDTDAADAATMNTLIDYIQAKTIPIVTTNQALDLLENVIDIGDNFSLGDGGIRAHFTGFDRTVGFGTVADTVKYARTKVGYPGTAKGLFTGRLDTGNYYSYISDAYPAGAVLFRSPATAASIIRFKDTGAIEMYVDDTLVADTNYTPTLRVTLDTDEQKNEVPIKIKEAGAAVGNDAGYGQLWVKNANPCELWFTDDVGGLTQLA